MYAHREQIHQSESMNTRDALSMKRIVTTTVLLLVLGTSLVGRTQRLMSKNAHWTEFYNTIAKMGLSRDSEKENFSKLSTQESKSSLFESRYILADPDRFGMNITVARSDRGNHYHLQIDFMVPTDESITNFYIITTYGSQMEGGRRSYLSEDTFPPVQGNWTSGDRVTLHVDLPKAFADPDKGWNLTFCIGTVETCLPSPNLLKSVSPTRRNTDSLSQLKTALDSYSNLRASRISEFPLSLSGNYQISKIQGCVIFLVHTSTILDRNHDGGKTTTTSSVNLANLSADPKVSEKTYGSGWKPSSRWVLSDDLIGGMAAIPTESVIERFPGRGEVDKSQSHKIEIEFMDPYVAEVIRKMMINEVTACGKKL